MLEINNTITHSTTYVDGTGSLTHNSMFSNNSIIDQYGYPSASSDLDQINKKFNSFISNNFTVETGLLPPGVKAIIPGVVVYERPPDYKLVQSISAILDEIDYDEHTVQTYRIPVPWQLYIVTYSLNPYSYYRTTSVKMYYMSGPLTSPDTPLYLPLLPNFFTNGDLCPPRFSNSDDINMYEQNISGVIASSYNWVWNSGFNADLVDSFYEYVSHQSCVSYQDIATYSLTGSRYVFINNVLKYMETKTLEDIINMKFPNPSYSSYYDQDLDTAPVSRDQFIDDYISNNFYDNFEGDRDDEDDLESHRDALYHDALEIWESEYGLRNKIKTYSMILDYCKESDYYYDSINSVLSPSPLNMYQLTAALS